METTARVVAVDAGRARLECAGLAACTGCGSGRGCALRWLGRSRAGALEVPDQTDERSRLQPGQAVTIAVGDAQLLRAVALVYLPPLAGLLGGALLGHGLSPGGDAGTAIGALLGSVAGVWLARYGSRVSPPRITVRAAGEGPG